MSRQSAKQAPAAETAAIAAHLPDLHEQEFARLVASMQVAINAAHALKRPVFTTAATGLYDIYLNSFATDRQYHNCHCCRHFIDRYAGLACVGEHGETEPLLWWPQMNQGFYQSAVQSLCAKVSRSKVTGVFLTQEPRLGTHETGPWTHLAVHIPEGMRHRHATLSPGQSAAARAMDHQTVQTALGRYAPSCCETALTILKAEALPMSERFVGPVEFLRDIHAAQAKARTMTVRSNVLWRAIATAPEGFCHPTTSMSGTLLDDIANRYPYDDIRKRFSAKVAPLKFQRPQALPAAGTIAEAERLVDTMRLRPSLKRRYARLEDLRPIWRPAQAHPQASRAPGSVFGHIKARIAQEPASMAVLPEQTVTWEKFARTVLPGAHAIDMLVPRGNTRFIAFTTAENFDAPPLLKWDRPEERNPVAWYVYPGGSSASQWGLAGGSYARVTAVVPLPTMWGSRPMPHEGDGVVLVLEGCRERSSGSMCLFPQFMRSELHPVRSVIEAYSNAGSLSGPREATGCGFDVRHSTDAIGATVRVRSATATRTYLIDRWD